jgi:hypothetical protein
MKFEAKKKSLAAAVSLVRSVQGAISLNDSVGTLFLVAEGKSLYVRVVEGTQVIDAAVRDVTVEDIGGCKVDADALEAALKLQGDTFKASLSANKLNYTCGKAKSGVPLRGNTDALEYKIPVSTPKTDIIIPFFKNLLNAVNLKEAETPVDRTLHFEEGKVRAEVSDGYRAITTVAHIDSGSPSPTTFVLPRSVNMIPMVTEGAHIGFDDRNFVMKTPGLLVCMPKAGGLALKVVTEMTAFLESQAKHGEFEITHKELSDMLADVTAIVGAKYSDTTHLTLTLSPKGGKAQGSSDGTSVDVEFDVKSATAKTTIKTYPSMLKELLGLFKGIEVLSITVYDKAMVINGPIVNDGTALMSQTAMQPLTSLAVSEALPTPKAADPAPAAEKAPAKKPVVKAKEPEPVVEAPKAKEPPPPVIVAPDEEEEPEESFDDEE